MKKKKVKFCLNCNPEPHKVIRVDDDGCCIDCGRKISPSNRIIQLIYKKLHDKPKKIKKIELNHSWDLEFIRTRNFNDQTKFNMEITDKVNELISAVNSLKNTE